MKPDQTNKKKPENNFKIFQSRSKAGQLLTLIRIPLISFLPMQPIWRGFAPETWHSELTNYSISLYSPAFRNKADIVSKSLILLDCFQTKNLHNQTIIFIFAG